MVLHAALSSEDVVVIAAVTDVLILMIYACSKFMDEKCVNIETILSYLGK